MARDKEEDYLTTAPKKQQVMINTENTFPDMKNIPGNSVDEHRSLEEANAIIAQNEIGQQNENL
ncbi:hypothetical protein [Ectobacillus polymachus]|uniref:hypothetical protein n=1 Tax=Ectobacillus polymachus TaxID=1508806 RepID=UPI003A874D48